VEPPTAYADLPEKRVYYTPPSQSDTHNVPDRCAMIFLDALPHEECHQIDVDHADRNAPEAQEIHDQVIKFKIFSVYRRKDEIRHEDDPPDDDSIPHFDTPCLHVSPDRFGRICPVTGCYEI